RMYRHRALSRFIGLAQRHLDLDGVVVLKRERRPQRELHKLLAPHLTPRRQHKLHKRRTRQQHLSKHRVITQPPMRTQPQPTRNQPPTTPTTPIPTTSNLNHRAQQRMPRRQQPNRTQITPTTNTTLKPKPLALKRIRRQPHPRTRPLTRTLEPLA